MSRVQRILGASALLVIAALGLLVAATQTTMTWYQAPGADGMATKQIAVFEPAVVGTVIAAVAVLALLVHLVLVIRRAVPRLQWVVAVALTVATVIAAVLVSIADRPTF
ncbi:hypothetical protein SAMN06295974_1378 [Plantibacter flavus]|uniref:Uncharacterized protein n=1 Tax=Plantibacter flavus TaxID=150123 RepID=A0A3N2C7C6_9MICO|nr:hypothetical protein [Plantibacter flavus]ROR83310.1 hypothetical protein EDD42_3421 [Plantibacter flavus]SMG22477.1 hypothetical protein SAMN06295974_1378 [Plantibacter flavus]